MDIILTFIITLDSTQCMLKGTSSRMCHENVLYDAIYISKTTYISISYWKKTKQIIDSCLCRGNTL